MKSILFNVPDSIELDDNEAILMLAFGLYKKGKISIGQAANLVGVSKRTMIELMGLEGIEIISHSAADLESDLQNARNHHR